MKRRFLLFLRGKTYYCEDTLHDKQESLRTKDKAVALRLVNARNEAEAQPQVSLQIARVYLRAGDPGVAKRTWQAAMDELTRLKRGPTRERHASAMRDAAFATIRDRPIIETQAEHFLKVLNAGTVSTNIYLRRLHNFALDMGWLPWPVLPKRQWPQPEFKEKRAITRDEHQKIIAGEGNSEWRAFFELLWHTGGAQTDVATLRAEDIDWENRVIGYARRKTGSISRLTFSEKVAELLHTRPAPGPLFPRLAELHEKHRAKHFNRRCRLLGLKGISLHSYRYSWAERAKQAGYPERFAQEALGHSSKAIARAYARNAQMTIPSLDSYEDRLADRVQRSVADCKPAV